MPSSKPLRALMASWNELYPLKGKEHQEASRNLRLVYCAKVLGHPISSCSELRDADLQRVVSSMQRELRDRGILPPARRAARPSNLRQFPNRNTATKGQVWKIRQLESHLGWSSEPTRLSGFLRQFFKKDRPEHLTHGQAWKAIEALFAVAARAEVKRRLGPAHQVGKSELAAATADLKSQLSTFSTRTEGESQNLNRTASTLR